MLILLLLLFLSVMLQMPRKVWDQGSTVWRRCCSSRRL